jgi:hypothetical protein
MIRAFKVTAKVSERRLSDWVGDFKSTKMSMTILATKLQIPLPRPNVVRRPRLNERLNQGAAA